MEQPQLNWIVNFIWGKANDVHRDIYVRIKYREVIQPMAVLHNHNAVLEPPVGRGGDSNDNALTEAFIELHKTHMIHNEGSWCGINQVDYQPLEWFDKRKLLGPTWNPATEYGNLYYQRQSVSPRRSITLEMFSGNRSDYSSTPEM